MARITETRTVHAGWGRFLVSRIQLADGQEVSREIEDHGYAVAVLPYCVETRTAILVGQLRAPMLFAANEAENLEAPAGRREGSDPGADARRELEEEVGLRVERLDFVMEAWAMPGISTERIGLFLAAFGPEHRVGTGGGLASEGETLRVVEVGLDELWAMLARHELKDMKTALLLHALRFRRPDLFGPDATAPA